ncbi:GNAT family N-acetyltransferase [Leptolyngbya sp. FACHB-36]|uniref:GNAT family N-acetyltransferase n=1 Tax=Leptolyngbya sp. FACHB-36 TaxID=2692808 RepID=UPI001681A567|nr:GNAT family N-acetyltransferase [Leptolyngbya sp. FACHB-36]MBD2019540.1 GNAT family N-acetyltransferase [Leptolyngbya sp. FACHB-36]
MLIETHRLILREFEPADDRWLAQILANPLVMKSSLTGPLSSADTQAKIQSFMASYAQHGFGKWAVFLKPRNELIGYCGIAVETIDNREEWELGYRLDPKFWSRGLASEAAIAALHHGFTELNLPYILGIVERANLASVRVLEKTGMQYERETTFHGVQMDVYRATNPSV